MSRNEKLAHIKNDFSNVGRYQYYLANYKVKNVLRIQLNNGKYLIKSERGFSNIKFTTTDFKRFFRVLIYFWFGGSISMSGKFKSCGPKYICYNKNGQSFELDRGISDDFEFKCTLDPGQDSASKSFNIFSFLKFIDNQLGLQISHFLNNPIKKTFNNTLNLYLGLYLNNQKELFYDAIKPTRLDYLVYRRMMKLLFS